MQKRILVTGGAGFLGSHLCEALIANNDQVFCLDDFYTGSMDNIEQLMGLPNFELIQQDVIEKCDIEVDEIYNLASPASPVHYQKNPIYTWRTNVIGTQNMLDLASKNNCKLLQASTSEVYGDPQQHPQTEHYWGHVNPIGIRACYDESKRAAETLCFDYSRYYGLPIKVARIFNTYGPKMTLNDGRVVTNFVEQALNGETITLYGEGEQTRSFCYVSDLISGLVKLMNADNTITGPVNLGNDREMTVRSLADKVIALTNTSSSVDKQPMPEDDPNCRRPDITLAKQLLDWQPQIELDQGLQKTIDYIRDQLNTSNKAIG